MKQLIILVLVTISCQLSAQSELCIKEKWIAVKNDSSNNHLFTISNDSIDPVFQEILELVNSKKISLFCGYDGWCKNQTGQHISQKIFDNQFWTNGFDSILGYNPYFEIFIQSDIALVDSNGQNVIYTDEYGMQSFVYEPPIIRAINLTDLNELQIKEEKVEGKFQPTQISFCITDSDKIKELFWIDIQSLKKATKNKSLISWIEKIEAKTYMGFQYKQTQCGEEYKR